MKRFVRVAFTATMIWCVLTPVAATPSDAREVDLGTLQNHLISEQSTAPLASTQDQ